MSFVPGFLVSGMLKMEGDSCHVQGEERQALAKSAGECECDGIGLFFVFFFFLFLFFLLFFSSPFQ